MRWHAASRGSSRPTLASGHRCSSTGSTASPPTASATTSTKTCSGSPTCGGRSSTASTPTPRTSGTRQTLARLREGPDRPARAALAVRPYPAAIHRHRTARGAVHPPRPAPVAAAPEQRPVAGARRRPPAPAAQGRHQPPPGPPSVARHPRPRSSRNAAQPAKRRHRRIRRRRNHDPTPCWVGCSPTSRQRGPARLGRNCRRRPLGADPQLPRCRPPDRRASRGAAGHAARRPDA